MTYNSLRPDLDVLKREIMVIARGAAVTAELLCLVFDLVDEVEYQTGLARTHERSGNTMERR